MMASLSPVPMTIASYSPSASISHPSGSQSGLGAGASPPSPPCTYVHHAHRARGISMRKNKSTIRATKSTNIPQPPHLRRRIYVRDQERYAATKSGYQHGKYRTYGGPTIGGGGAILQSPTTSVFLLLAVFGAAGDISHKNSD